MGIATPEGVVLGVEKRVQSPLLEASSIEKIMEIDSHLGCAMSGLTADARTMIDHARVTAQNHTFTYDERIKVESATQAVCDLALRFGEGVHGDEAMMVSFLSIMDLAVVTLNSMSSSTESAIRRCSSHCRRGRTWATIVRLTLSCLRSLFAHRVVFLDSIPIHQGRSQSMRLKPLGVVQRPHKANFKRNIIRFDVACAKRATRLTVRTVVANDSLGSTYPHAACSEASDGRKARPTQCAACSGTWLTVIVSATPFLNVSPSSFQVTSKNGFEILDEARLQAVIEAM